ncbi:MAG: tetratricopeptide repeat protein [Candidatus Ozemobacteraceae bacterium]
MKRFIVIFFAVFFFPCLSHTGNLAEAASSGAIALMEEAVKNRARGAQANAFKLLRQAISEARRSDQKTLARLMLGDFLLEAENLDEARDIFEEVLSSSPAPEAEAEARFRLAQILQRTGLLEKSRTAAQELLRKFPNTEYAQLARLLLKSHVTPLSRLSSMAKITETPISSTSSRLSSQKQSTLSLAPSRPQASATPSKKESKDVSTASDEVSSDESSNESSNETSRKSPGEDKTPVSTSPIPSSPLSESSEEKVICEKKSSGGSFEVVDFASLEALKSSGKTNESPAIKPVSTEPVVAPADAAPGDLLVYKPVSQAEQEEMASSILADQNLLKEQPDSQGNDELLFRLAVSTARFGEHLEACKLFDKILSSCPSSPRVEDAYLESVRLRAILKAFPAVMKWGATFLKSFPTSKRRPDVERLIEYARTQGRIGGTPPSRPPERMQVPPRQKKKGTAETNVPKSFSAVSPRSEPSSSQAIATPAPDSPAKRVSSVKLCGDTPPPGDTSASFRDPASNALRAERRYVKARERLDANRYALAQADLTTLANDHPKAPLVWYDLALVQIQKHAFSEAERSLNTLLALDPENAEARSLMGYVHFQSKQYDQAAADYDQAGSTSKEGLAFFDPEFAARRMENSARRPKSGANP